MMRPMCRVLAYRQTENLGDAIQTDALIGQKHRLGLLGLLGFRYDEPVTIDVEPWAAWKNGEGDPPIPGLSRFARHDLFAIVHGIEQVMHEFLDRRGTDAARASEEARRAYAATLRTQSDRDHDVVAAWEALVQRAQEAG